jgi:putative ABC transport system permease protein
MTTRVRRAPWRSCAARRAGAVRAALHERLAQPGQLVTVTPAAAYLHRSIAGDRAVLGIVGVMVGAMTVVVLIGSMGMAYWLVGTRTREIGLRRALGATRGDVVRHVVLQNTVFTAAGTVIGMGMVLLVLPSLIRHQHEFGVKWPLIAVTAVAVIAINLVATLIPARRAAAVPPVVVSRTV